MRQGWAKNLRSNGKRKRIMWKGSQKFRMSSGECACPKSLALVSPIRFSISYSGMLRFWNVVSNESSVRSRFFFSCHLHSTEWPNHNALATWSPFFQSLTLKLKHWHFGTELDWFFVHFCQALSQIHTWCTRFRVDYKFASVCLLWFIIRYLISKRILKCNSRKTTLVS